MPCSFGSTPGFLWAHSLDYCLTCQQWEADLLHNSSPDFWRLQFSEMNINVVSMWTCLVIQLSSTLCNPMDYSPPGTSVHGILQARILEWVAMSFSRGSPQPRDQTQVSWIAEDSLPPELPGKTYGQHVKWKLLSHVQHVPWTIESMEFSRSEYCSGSLSLLQGIFPTQGLNPGLPHCRQILYHLSHQGRPGST